MPAADPVVLATERRKRHRSLRFGGRAPVVPAPGPVTLGPVSELRTGRGKEHLVVHFEHKQQAANEA
jgi:hypothetical protein